MFEIHKRIFLWAVDSKISLLELTLSRLGCNPNAFDSYASTRNACEIKELEADSRVTHNCEESPIVKSEWAVLKYKPMPLE